MDTVTRLAFLLAEYDNAAKQLERRARDIQSARARLLDNQGRVGKNDLIRETQTVARACAALDTSTLYGDLLELLNELGDAKL